MPRFSNPQRKQFKHRTPTKHNNCKCQKKPETKKEKKVAISEKTPINYTEKTPNAVEDT